MKDDNSGHGSYVQKVRQDTQRLVQDLVRENGELRRLVACLESEKESLTEDKKDYEDQLAVKDRKLARYEEEKEELSKKLTNIETANLRFSDMYAAVEAQNNDLANLYVASYRLHGTLERREVLEAVKEIIINLIGCEELAIFEMNPERTDLLLTDGFGLSGDDYERIPVGEGIIGGVAKKGETYLATESGNGFGLPQEEHLTACIPLKIENRVNGAVAIFRLLPQKTNGLETLDHELLDLLATQAATALYSTTLHSLADREAIESARINAG